MGVETWPNPALGGKGGQFIFKIQPPHKKIQEASTVMLFQAAVNLRLGCYISVQSSFHKYWMLEDKDKGQKPRPVGRKQAINPVIVYIHMQSVWEMSSKWHYRKEIMSWLVMQKCNEINQRAEMLILMDAICAEGTRRKKWEKGCTVHQNLVCKLRSIGG